MMLTTSATLSLIQKLAESGVLGVLLALAIGVAIYFYKKFDSEREREIEEKEKTNLVLRANADTLKELLVTIERNNIKNENREKTS